MKVRFYSIIICLFMLTVRVASAQEIRSSNQSSSQQVKAGESGELKIPVASPSQGTLILNGFYDLLPIEGYSGNEIVLTCNSDRIDEAPNRSKGLKAIYAAGTDNTGLGVAMTKEGNDIRLECLLPITNHDGKYHLRVPESMSLRIKSGCERDNSLDLQNIKGEIEASVCQDIRLRNVSGPLELSTISGNIDVVFSALSAGSKPISIANISGEIDVTLPAKSGVNLEMRNVSGSMYSDFDFNQEHKDLQRVGGNTINAKLNGGGTDINLTNVSGNIYLRKE